ncbi:MAG: virulence protein [Lachnospiraceae bacterium]|nr:virulence protein [Lachnospiraceae bacterium]
MRFEFNRTGAERKALVQAMGEILEVKPRYLGMPTAAYEVDYFHIDRIGTVEFDDRADSEEIENLLERLAERGIVAAPAETAQEGGTVGETAEPDNYAEAPETAPQKANMGLTVAMPRESFTDAALENLRKLVDAKGSLIKSALAVDSLPIETDGEKVSFPWFAEGQDSESVKAYTHFIAALCDMARNQKRITAKEKPADNEKYAFRCFLLRLGFIGTEYKGERKILLKNLSGSSAFKNGERKEAGSDEVSE